MQNVVIDKPYAFVAPSRGMLWPRLLRALLPWRLRHAYGLASVTCAGSEKLAASLAAGDGVLIAPNHCRPCDPEVIHELSRRAAMAPPYMMASWHLFMESRLQSFVLRTTGTFSIYREGTDRTAIATAVELLAAGGRALVLFPEGVQTRTNDRLNPMLDGAAFIARHAARDRAKHDGGRVVVHPMALRYRYGGDIETAVLPVLTEIEERLSWRPQIHLPLRERLEKLGSALLSLKEIEHFDRPQDGTLAERLARLIDGLLDPLEKEWLHGKRERHVAGRVKALRAAVLHDMLGTDLPETERARRWDQMADMYLAQSISFYPPDYVAGDATPERVLETVERLEEDLTDTCRVYAPMHVVVTVGDAIAVSPERQHAHGDDPLMAQVDAELRRLLGLSA